MVLVSAGRSSSAADASASSRVRMGDERRRRRRRRRPQALAPPRPVAEQLPEELGHDGESMAGESAGDGSWFDWWCGW
ncbi:hypothetical protein ACCO45_007021 [Purpureocillium lilacinum]|uniref:Uncharacterized protein n=1 Tax=Purpureocillium lilacinum TaxID=33203 RepID=A0ACC4DTH9_PURLI